MSGLIWASLGKSISDIGDSMYRSAEAQVAEQRATQRAIALEQIRDSMAEQKVQREAAKAMEIEDRAGQIGRQREDARLDNDVKGLIGRQSQISGSSPAASEEEIRKLVEENPQYREVYRQAGYIEKGPSRREQRLQSADDQIQAARELGAGSSLLKSYQEARKSVLEDIKSEFNEEVKRSDQLRAERREDRQSELTAAQIASLNKNATANMMRADAAIISANRPRGGGGGVGSMSEVKLNQEAETLRKAAKDASRKEDRLYYEGKLREVMDEIASRRGGGSSGKTSPSQANTGDNGNVKPDASKTPSRSPYSDGTRLKGPDGKTYVVRNGSPVLEK